MLIGERYSIGSVRKQTAVSGKDRLRIDHRYIVSRCEQYDLPAMGLHKNVWHNNEATPRLAAKRGYDRFDFGDATNTRRDRLDFEVSGRGIE